MRSRWRRPPDAAAVRVVVRAVVCGVVACGGVAACSADDPSAPGAGVTGTTVVDVGCPTLATGQTCPTRPLAARLEFSPVGAAGSGVTEETGADGRFTVDLAPGTYELVATVPGGGPLPSAEPMTVTVQDGEYSEVTVTFDSGVR
jgi:hypothetical protein